MNDKEANNMDHKEAIDSIAFITSVGLSGVMIDYGIVGMQNNHLLTAGFLFSVAGVMIIALGIKEGIKLSKFTEEEE